MTNNLTGFAKLVVQLNPMRHKLKTAETIPLPQINSQKQIVELIKSLR